MVAAPEIVAELNANGFAIVEEVISEHETLRLLAAIERLADIGSKLQRRGEVFAVRNLLDVVPEIAKLATSEKTWHQDVTIAVQEKVEVEEFGPWTTKAGVIHVQPPASVLEHMLSVRLHLDPCPATNGALRVIPGSHLHGRIPEEKVPAIRTTIPEHVCEVGLGGALLMRPLLLHASSPSQNAAHRRVIHLDFASAQLPSGMRWFSESQVS